jgi:hypothetical protein
MLEDCDDIYDYENGVFLVEKLNSKLKRNKKYFSEQFCEIISRMLEVDEKNRPDFIEICKMLKLDY